MRKIIEGMIVFVLMWEDGIFCISSWVDFFGNINSLFLIVVRRRYMGIGVDKNVYGSLRVFFFEVSMR